MKIHIRTPKLILRDIMDSDLKDMYELDSNPEVHKYLGRNPVTHLDESEKVISSIQKQYLDYGIGRWAVIDKKTNSFMGWAGIKFETKVRDEMDYYDLGYRLKKEYWGQGFASEAALACLRYGFQNMRLNEVYGGAHAHNSASNKILKKVGLKYLETFEFDGESHHWYGISREEWFDKFSQ